MWDGKCEERGMEGRRAEKDKINVQEIWEKRRKNKGKGACFENEPEYELLHLQSRKKERTREKK